MSGPGWTSRRRWMLWLFGLKPEAGDEPKAGEAASAGILMLQVDGLSRRQFERAIGGRGKLPFLRRLVSRQGWRLESFYSGIPSTTPAVQAELFYGVRTAVPAFAFFDKDAAHAVEMIQPSAAASVERRCQRLGEGLLRGGSSHSNIYTGGAREAHLCPAALDGTLPGPARLGWWRWTLALAWNFPAVVRTVGALLIEYAILLADVSRGRVTRGDFHAELASVPKRMAVAVLMREWIVVGAELDLTRGLPIVHANFLGYDEQSHGRGPESAIAHWSLRQIDRAIRRIVRAARRSPVREYQVWVYSDHGQEATIPFEEYRGMSLPELVRELVAGIGGASPIDRPDDSPIPGGRPEKGRSGGSRAQGSRAQGIGSRAQGIHGHGIRGQRAGWIGGPWTRSFAGLADAMSRVVSSEEDGICVVAKGPLGHVYLGEGWEAARKRELGSRLATEGRVPWVFFIDPRDGWLAWHGGDRYRLPADRDRLIPPGQPFADVILTDLETTCRHRDAGDLVVCGWQIEGPTVSFVHERGGHAGPGPEETHGFILVPPDARPGDTLAPGVWRPGDLRAAILGRSQAGS